MNAPLADRIRPKALSEVVGQEHLLGEGKLLDRLVKSGHIPNMIFYGPPGTGKTTVANILAGMTQKKLYKLNATNASVKDIKEIIDALDTMLAPGGVLLYLDEIQNFNKKQQQSLLEYIENGKITLISSTTENPYFYVYNAILSRSTVLEFKPLGASDVLRALNRAVDFLNEEMKISIHADEAVLSHMAETCGGDLRQALNALEISVLSAPSGKKGGVKITMEIAEECSQKRNIQYDKFGDAHYDILSAFQKSIRGSDAQAGIHYLARLVAAGDLPSICRRLLVIAAEDVGLAYPNAIAIVKACVDAANQLGFPEARIPLAEAVILLCQAPKSNSGVMAIDEALSDLNQKEIGEIPAYLRDSHYKGAEKLGRGLTYQYPHAFLNHYVKQQYLPDGIKDARYYVPGENKLEQQSEQYQRGIRGEER